MDYKEQISTSYLSSSTNSLFKISIPNSLITSISSATQLDGPDNLKFLYYFDHFNFQIKNDANYVRQMLKLPASSVSAVESSAVESSTVPAETSAGTPYKLDAKIQTWLDSLGRTVVSDNFFKLPPMSFRPTLTNIDQIVFDYAKAHNIQIGSERQIKQYFEDINFRVLPTKESFGASNHPPSLINGEQCNDNLFVAIDTVGDGTCFVHSIMLSISENYRKCNDHDKGLIGRYIRVQLRLPGESTTYLLDDTIEKMTALFGIGVLYFQARNGRTVSCAHVGDSRKPCIILVNNNRGHYMAVMYGGEFIVQSVDIECVSAFTELID